MKQFVFTNKKLYIGFYKKKKLEINLCYFLVDILAEYFAQNLQPSSNGWAWIRTAYQVYKTFMEKNS